MNEEEDKKHSVGSGEGDPRDHVDGLRHSDRVRWFFFANLDETWLKEIILQMKDGNSQFKGNASEQVLKPVAVCVDEK